MLKKIIYVFIALSFVNITTACAKEKKAATTDVKAIEEIVKNYLLNNPEVIKEAMQNHEAKIAKQKQENAQKMVKENLKELEADENSPVFANPDGKITIVEFFDYNCGFCKRMFPTMNEITKENKNVRWVMKEVALLSNSSDFAARMALAAEKMGKYKEFHTALMTHKSALTNAIIVKLAAQVGLNTDKMEEIAKSNDVSKQLRKNMELAQKLNLQGVPMFVIDGQIFGGAMPKEAILEAIK
jgi:protein-disulfide isomerase